ncbi:MAG: hypothetical protein KC416_03920 [Myxococcales bacterium]|nr:hypothetical protein [Myxococcales bacterium]
MLATTHTETVPADFRGRALPRCHVATVDRGNGHVISNGMGLPRLWFRAAKAVTGGFCQGFDGSTETGRPRIEQAVESARRSLLSSSDQLIERMAPDATLVAVLLNGSNLNAIHAGRGRVYVNRDGQPKRLTERQEGPLGLLRTPPVHTTAAVSPGDLVIAGTASAFSVRSIGRLAQVLEEEPNTAPSVIAHLLTDPARRAGVGAATLVMRIH